MSFIALRMLTPDRAKYVRLVIAIASCTLLLQNHTSIFPWILSRTGSQIAHSTDASIEVMGPETEYFKQTKALKHSALPRMRGIYDVAWAMRLSNGNPVVKTETGKFAISFKIGIDDTTLAGATRRLARPRLLASNHTISPGDNS